MASLPVKNPVSNRESQEDRLAVVIVALASFEPPQNRRPERAAAAGLCFQHARRHRGAEGHRPRPSLPVGRRSRKSPPSRRCKNPTRCSATSRSPASRSASSFPRIRNPTGRRWKARCARWPGRFTRPGRPIRAPACRSIPTPRSPAAEIGCDAAVVPVARGPEARSALAGPPDRAGKSRRDDLSAAGPAFIPDRFRTRRIQFRPPPDAPNGGCPIVGQAGGSGLRIIPK